jgi:hypothetical protein
MEFGGPVRHRRSMDPEDAEAYRTLQRDICTLFPAGAVRERGLAWLSRLVTSNDGGAIPGEERTLSRPQINAVQSVASLRRSRRSTRHTTE